MRHAVELEDHVAGRLVILVGAEHVGHADRSARRRLEAGLDAPRGVECPVIDPLELAAGGRLGIPRANGHPAPALDQAEAKRTELQHRRLSLLVVHQRQAGDRFAGDRQAIGRAIGPHHSSSQGQRAGMRRT